jgi:glycosidase
MMEFHISRKARERYQFAESLFSYSGNVIFANVAACREFAYRMNTVRDAERHPELSVHAGQLYAMGLIDEASHALMARYRKQYDPAVFTQALEWFSGLVGAEPLGRMLLTFVEEFPGLKVMRGELTARKWLSGETEGVSHWAVALEELLLLWTANRNEAFKPFEELFEEKPLAERTVYREVTRQFPEYFATRPLIPVAGAKGVSLLELLRAPATGAPGSLSGQLKLIRTLWKPLLGESLDHYLEIAAGILHEEEMAIWLQFNPPAVQAQEAARRHRESGTKQWPSVVSTAQVPVFGDPAHEYEKFSPDMAWMPTAVMIAKSTYVWLAQLSRQYGRAIHKLDEIPDEELTVLAARGLNTLWLIGVWERSRASKTIKQLCGNSDAVASAYSLFDYTIADDLGGEAAYVTLRDRAYHHGIRLASDMVPNHMGIDSPWVVEHPDWFMSRPDAPYPAYSFNGPDLSQDGRVEIKIEDHYFDETDAAVVFQRRDRQSGETRYIYHGNDGTSFPWNDTAQLDYLNPAVREQVIQTILHVARLFPVIRFDAAMTLAKRHFHRLWFPGPGTSGAIPSRAEYGMSQAEFNQAMPQEFWREVVDRVAAEVPGTLLLAEAFWLMEGYFVRTLGMHRVYNSAFMVMLRDEDNAKYRSVIKNTIEFDPDILKRYVNFMSNPDERTAIDQFGKGDKCFGVAAMMATLPGLPMFGHGQIEGFTEKYGMEYQRPRYDENADKWLVERHEREIAPLLKRRRLFAESDNFLLYDFYLDAGKVDENVFAYSNRNGGERALVVFNNRYAETQGTIDWSAAYADKSTSQLRQQKVGEGLGFGDAGKVLAWRDSLTGLEYLRRANDLIERGLRLELHAYQCHVFLDWRELTATAEQPWDRLCDQLNGRGVASLEDALVKLELQPAHDALQRLLEPGLVRGFADLAEHPRTLGIGANLEIEAERTAFFEAAWTRCESFLHVAQRAYVTLAGAKLPTSPGLLRAAYRARLRSAMRIPAVEVLFPAPWTVAARRMLPCPSPQLTATAMWGPVLGWCALELLAESIDAEKPEPVALDLFDRLRLREPFAQAFAALGYEGDEAWRVAARVKVGLLAEAGVGRPEAAEKTVAAETAEGERAALAPALWLDPDVRWLTSVHETEGHEYFVRERYEELLWWLQMPSLLRLASESGFGLVAANRAAVRVMSASIDAALKTAKEADYRVDLLLGSEKGVAAESAEAAIEPETAALEHLCLANKEEPVAPEIAEAADKAHETEPAVETQPSPIQKVELDEPVIEAGKATEFSVPPEEPVEAEAAKEEAAETTPLLTETAELEAIPAIEAVPESAVKSAPAADEPAQIAEETLQTSMKVEGPENLPSGAEAHPLYLASSGTTEVVHFQNTNFTSDWSTPAVQPESVEQPESIEQPEVSTQPEKVELVETVEGPKTIVKPEPVEQIEPIQEPELIEQLEAIEPEVEAGAGVAPEVESEAIAEASAAEEAKTAETADATWADAQAATAEPVTEDEPAPTFAETIRSYFQQKADARKVEVEAGELAEKDANEADDTEDRIEYIDEDADEEADEDEDVIEYVDEEDEEEAEESRSSIEEAEVAAPEAEAEYDAEYAAEDGDAIDQLPPAATAEEEPFEAELADAPTISEEPEANASGAKGLVGSIASIFARKPKETITLGLNDASKSPAEATELVSSATEESSFALPSSIVDEEEPAPADEEEPAPIEPFEPPAPEITFSADPGAPEAPKTLAVAPVIPSLVEPFEPPAPEIEFTAMSASEVAAERRQRIVVPSTSEWLGNRALGDSTADATQPPVPHRRKDDLDV